MCGCVVISFVLGAVVLSCKSLVAPMRSADKKRPIVPSPNMTFQVGFEVECSRTSLSACARPAAYVLAVDVDTAQSMSCCDTYI